MGKIIVKNAVKRKSGFLYYIDGEGNICTTPLARKGKSKKTKKVTKKTVKKKVTKKVTKKPTKRKK